MKMGYAIVIRLGNQWCHRDDIFGIVVFDGTEITKLTLICVIVGYNVGSLHIDPFAFGLCADKINFASLKLSENQFRQPEVVRPSLHSPGVQDDCR